MMRKKILPLMIFLFLTVMVVPVSAVGESVFDKFGHDLSEEHWYSVADIADVENQYYTAAMNNMGFDREFSSLYVYAVYVNYNGLRTLYVAMVNYTLVDHDENETITGTQPAQVMIQYYVGPGGTKNIVFSGFTGLAAFKEEENTTIIPNAPDRNDSVYLLTVGKVHPAWRSVLESQGVEIIPAEVEIIPLSFDENKTEWTWGIKYSDVYLRWFRTCAGNDTSGGVFAGVIHLNSLNFTYTLRYNDNNTAYVYANYEIGPIVELWLANSTGGNHIDYYVDANLTQFIMDNEFKLSLWNYQAAFTLNHHNRYRVRGENMTAGNMTEVEIGNASDDAPIDASNGSLSIETDDGNRIFDVNYRIKKEYQVGNLTADTVTKAYHPRYLWENRLLLMSSSHMGWIFATRVRFNSKFQAAMEYYDIRAAGTLYTINYPVWNNEAIIHDPVYITYLGEESTGFGLFGSGLILVFIFGAVIGVVVVLLLLRRRK